VSEGIVDGQYECDEGNYFCVILCIFQDFRDELESLIEEKTQTGKDPSGLLALQQIADLVLSTPGPSCPLSPPGMWPPSRKGTYYL